jgi:hypothetical protein
MMNESLPIYGATDLATNTARVLMFFVSLFCAGKTGAL